jgi:arabinoxylan arabinofuranohydrolase
MNTLINNMLKKLSPGIILAAFGVCLVVTVHADNPVVQTAFTADPAPMVYKDTVYLYVGHDEDDAPEGMARFIMRDWRCYTSTDMVNWTDRGVVASLKTFPWAVQNNGAWAGQVIERNGKFYFYVPINIKGWPNNVIAVAVADNPLGPFKDALGKPLIDVAAGYIDPTAFVDDDGQAYLYWGNPNLWYVKLNNNMISYSGEIIKDSSFAKVKGQKDPYHYQEGPWFYKRDSHYYMAYASTCCPEGIGYAMSTNATGPWEFKGYIMQPNGKSSGNHPGIIDYKGNSYVFGFNYQLNFMLTDKHHERRSVCVSQMTYKADGTIPELPWWNNEGAAQIGTFNPYAQTEAATICWETSVKTVSRGEGQPGVYVSANTSGAYIKIKGVDFGAKGAKKFLARVASATKGNAIELRLDSETGPLIGTLKAKSTGALDTWQAQSCSVKKAKGVHDLYLKFTGSDGPLMNLDYWKFE